MAGQPHHQHQHMRSGELGGQVYARAQLPVTRLHCQSCGCPAGCWAGAPVHLSLPIRPPPTRLHLVERCDPLPALCDHLFAGQQRTVRCGWQAGRLGASERVHRVNARLRGGVVRAEVLEKEEGALGIGDVNVLLGARDGGGGGGGMRRAAPGCSCVLPAGSSRLPRRPAPGSLVCL